MLVCILCCLFLANWVRFCPVLYWASLLRLRILLSASSWDRNEFIHISCVSISTWKCIWPSQWGKYFLVALNGVFHMGFAAFCVWIKINVWECVLLAVPGDCLVCGTCGWCWARWPCHAQGRSDWPWRFPDLCFSLWQPCFLPCSRCWSWALHFPFEVDGGRENLRLFCLWCVLFLPFPGSQIYGDC